MMYCHMIEEIEQERQEYTSKQRQLIREGVYENILAIVNTKIAMCNRFLALLKSFEEQEMALEAENEMIKNQK
ncbi:MAG: hypothetical protein IJV32_00035 [Bacteroidales bacterium]|nr:hypothetical protein [Bacteroidales bacterium]